MKRFSCAWPAIVSAVVATAVVDAARPQYGGVLRVDARATIRTLDPASPVADAGADSLAHRLRGLVFETLIDIDPAGGLRPHLAASWDADSAGTRWRFHLRPGPTLHDGRPLEPWQVAASLRATGRAWNVALDNAVIVIETARPEPGLPWELTDSRYAIAVRDSPAAVIGTGPFRVERIEASRLSLRAHDRYWMGRPFLDAVTVEMARSASVQQADLDAGRADVIELQPSDSRRAAERGVRIVASRSIDLFALIFEPARATAASLDMRRRFAGAVDRDATAAVLLQGRAQAALALLPPWLSGYPGAFVSAAIEKPTRAGAASLPADQRAVTLRVDPSDALARAIAERVAVDAREVGFTVTVQAPSGLAPRPDVRLIRLPLEPSSPDRALTRLAADLGPRTVGLATSEPVAAADAPLEIIARFERAVLRDAVIVPIVYVPALYAIGETIDVWDGQAVTPMGVLNLANIWIRR